VIWSSQSHVLMEMLIQMLHTPGRIGGLLLIDAIGLHLERCSTLPRMLVDDERLREFTSICFKIFCTKSIIHCRHRLQVVISIHTVLG
jgi:hypothetical protein